MFNLVPCDSGFEQEFADFCDYAGDVAAFAKNAGPQKLMLDYIRPDGHRALYVPDFFVRLNESGYFLVELKGKADNLVPFKARAAVEWCKAASKGKVRWRYLYVPYDLFQQNAAATVEELARACRPSLEGLIEEADKGQRQYTLFESTFQKQADDRFTEALQKAGLTKAPKGIEDTMRQTVQLLDYAVRARMPDLSHAFQPMLAPLDGYAIRILEQCLKPRIPAEQAQSREYFAPYLGSLPGKDRSLLDRNQRYLKDNLVFGRSIQKLGTLLFCLDYALTGEKGVSGVWRDVGEVFSGEKMKELYDVLREVNTFRNTRVAHVESKLADPEEAWKALAVWFRCLNQMENVLNKA